MRRVALIIGEHDPWETRPYIIKWMLPLWRDMGLEIAINRGPRRVIEADAAILHVDRTIVPRAYLDLARSYPRCVNGACGSISKRLIASGRIRPGDGYAGPVIVKTARNTFGRPDQETARAATGTLARWWSRRVDSLAKHAPWWVTGRLDRYPVFAGPSAVPWTTWHDPRFVIQRFVTDRIGDEFVVRRWCAFGSRTLSYTSHGRQPYIDGDNVTRREFNEAPPPPEVLAARAAFGADYCKIDYATDQHGTVIFDVNRTTGYAPEEFGREFARRLAPGLLDFL